MKKFIIIFSPVFITAIFVSFVVLKKTVKPSLSFQALTPSVGMNTTLKTASNTAVVEIKHDNSKLGLETPLKEVSLTKNNEEYIYQSIKDEMEIIYKPIDKGMKEEIILNKLPDLNKFSPPGSSFVEFSINMFLDNLSWGINADDMPIFFDESGKYQFHFQKPFAKDAKGETTTSLVYKIIPNRSPSLPPKIQTRLPYLKPAITKVFAQSIFPTPPLPKKKYTLVLSISKAWLSDPKRVFPVVIDPSVVNDPATAKPEIIEKRTAKSSTFAKGDGSFIAKFTINDQNYQDENNNWQTVDESLGDNEDFDGYAYEAKSMKHIVKVGGDGERKWYPRRNIKDEYIIIGKAESLTENNEGLALPLGDVAKTTEKISWENNDYSLNFTQNWKKIKFEIILKNESAPTSFRWPITFNNLTWDNWMIKSKDTLVANMIKPTAQDNSEKIVNLEVDFKDGYLTVKADTKDAQYPITIDPTLTLHEGEAGANNDTLLRGAQPDWTGEGDTYAKAGMRTYTEPDSWQASTILIKNDLSTLAGTTINSADFYYYQSTEEWTDSGGDDFPLTISRILSANGSWTEVESTWGHLDDGGGTHWAGDTGGDHGTDAGCSVSGTDFSSSPIGILTFANSSKPVGYEYHFSVGDLTEFAAMVLANYGYKLWGDNWGTPHLCLSEHATAAYRPKLVVDYDEPTPTPTPSPTPTPTPGSSNFDFNGVKMEGVKIN